VISFIFAFIPFLLILLCSPEAPQPKEEEPSWSDEENDVVHLTEETFGDALAGTSSLLVMFYAPCMLEMFYSCPSCL
jgi:hypothetical protein